MNISSKTCPRATVGEGLIEVVDSDEIEEIVTGLIIVIMKMVEIDKVGGESIRASSYKHFSYHLILATGTGTHWPAHMENNSKKIFQWSDMSKGRMQRKMNVDPE